MISPKYLILGIIVFILFAEGATGGLFLNTVVPGWQGIAGQGLCIAGGYMVQPIWDVGWAKIPVPVTDDWIFGAFFASLIGWLVIKRTAWTFRRKMITLVVALLVGMLIYKVLGLFVLYMAEVQYGMSNCIGQFQVGPILVEWEWFEPLHLLGVILGIGAVIAAILAFRKKAG